MDFIGHNSTSEAHASCTHTMTTQFGLGMFVLEIGVRTIQQPFKSFRPANAFSTQHLHIAYIYMHNT